MVLQEFEKLEESEQVYRLRGAVLIKQDVDDAKQAVRSRLDFIQSQLCVPFCSGATTQYCQYSNFS